jgi:hypothetical protein
MCQQDHTSSEMTACCHLFFPKFDLDLLLFSLVHQVNFRANFGSSSHFQKGGEGCQIKWADFACVIGPELCGGTKTEKGKVVGWLMGSLVSLSSKLRKN